MKNSFLQILFALILIVLGGAAEELLPRFFGLGFPVLLIAVQLQSIRWPLLTLALFAIAAGAMEDALGGLPKAASVSYFLMVALLVRRVGFARAFALFTYPCYLLWLAIWTGSATHGVIWMRLLASVPIGFVTACAMAWILAEAERRFALGEES